MNGKGAEWNYIRLLAFSFSLRSSSSLLSAFCLIPYQISGQKQWRVWHFRIDFSHLYVTYIESIVQKV